MSQFTKIALVGRPRVYGVTETLESLIQHLQSHDVEVVLESETAQLLPNHNIKTIQREELHKHCTLIVVVGGDGSLLNAAHMAVDQDLPVLGINRGNLGFLTDIRPEEFTKITDVLEGKYTEEKRFLLTAEIEKDDGNFISQNALNDVVLLPGNVAHMIEFSIHINNEFVCCQRADGLIIATPTGSTAYALSGGGPILHPKLDAIVLVPMFPHTLTSRPIVIDANSEIEICMKSVSETRAGVSCDGMERIDIPSEAKIRIHKKTEMLRLIHPNDYNYFETLRTKLNWESKA